MLQTLSRLLEIPVRGMPMTLVVVLAASIPALAEDAETRFTYKGELTLAGQPVNNGECSFLLRLYDDPEAGSILAEDVESDIVIGGRFTVRPDFGTSVSVEDQTLWLEIGVCCADDLENCLVPASYTMRSPRQRVTATRSALKTGGVIDVIVEPWDWRCHVPRYQSRQDPGRFQLNEAYGPGPPPFPPYSEIWYAPVDAPEGAVLLDFTVCRACPLDTGGSEGEVRLRKYSYTSDEFVGSASISPLCPQQHECDSIQPTFTLGPDEIWLVEARPPPMRSGEDHDGILLLSVRVSYFLDYCGDCPTDVDGNGETDPFDLAILLGAWGPVELNCLDANGDGAIGPFDLAVLLGAWGPCP